MNETPQALTAVTVHPNSHNAARMSDSTLQMGFWIGGVLIVLGIILTILSSRAEPKGTP